MVGFVSSLCKVKLLSWTKMQPEDTSGGMACNRTDLSATDGVLLIKCVRDTSDVQTPQVNVATHAKRNVGTQAKRKHGHGAAWELLAAGVDLAVNIAQAL